MLGEIQFQPHVFGQRRRRKHRRFRNAGCDQTIDFVFVDPGVLQRRLGQQRPLFNAEQRIARRFLFRFQFHVAGYRGSALESH